MTLTEYQQRRLTIYVALRRIRQLGARGERVARIYADRMRTAVTCDSLCVIESELEFLARRILR